MNVEIGNDAVHFILEIHKPDSLLCSVLRLLLFLSLCSKGRSREYHKEILLRRTGASYFRGCQFYVERLLDSGLQSTVRPLYHT
jgi:hypothetical protein